MTRKARHDGPRNENDPYTDPYASAYVKDLVNPQKSRNQLAAEHSDLRQSKPGSTESLGSLRTARGNIEDLKPFAGEITPGGFSHAGEVGLRLFDAAGNAGASGALHPSANPSRPADHTSRGSASPCDEGCGSSSHGESDLLSTAVANKNAFKDLIREQARRAMGN